MATTSLEELSSLPTEEVEDALRVALLPDKVLRLGHDKGSGYLTLHILDLEGKTLWSSFSTDPRTLLFNAYGFLLEGGGYKPRSATWRRNGEIQIPQRYGKMAYQGDVKIPDPEDLSPEEVMRIYGLAPNKDTSK